MSLIELLQIRFQSEITVLTSTRPVLHQREKKNFHFI